MEHPGLIKCLNDQYSSNIPIILSLAKAPPLLGLAKDINYRFAARLTRHCGRFYCLSDRSKTAPVEKTYSVRHHKLH